MKNNIFKTVLCYIGIFVVVVPIAKYLAHKDAKKMWQQEQKMLIKTPNSKHELSSYSKNAKNNHNYRTTAKQTLLMQSINKNVDEVKSILIAGADVNERDTSGRNVLHYISSTTSPEVVQTLINAGVNVNAKDKFNQTPLITYCNTHKNINIEILGILIRAGTNLNSTDSMFKSALSYLIENEDIDAIKLLIDSGANINIVHLNKTLMHEAVSSGNVDIINLMASSGANIDGTQGLNNEPLMETPLMFAIKENASLNVIKALLENKANPNLFYTYFSPYLTNKPNPKTVLELAIKYRRSEDIIKTLLKYGAKVTSDAVKNADYLKNTQLYWQMRDVIN